MAATYGLDLLNTTSFAYSTDYSGYFITPFYQIGTLLKTRQLQEVEFYLVKALATGEGIKIEYRTDLNGSWTTVGTYTFASLGAKLSHHDTVNIPDAFQIQFRISLLGTSTTTPELKNVVFE